MPPQEQDRRDCIWIQGIAVDLAEWFCAKYKLRAWAHPTCKRQIDLEDILDVAIAHKAFGIFVAAKCIEGQEQQQNMCSPGATSKHIWDQLEHLDNHPKVEEIIQERLDAYNNGRITTDFNLLYDWSTWTCCANTAPREYVRLMEEGIFESGCTTLDRAYMEGNKCGFGMAWICILITVHCATDLRQR